jgi:protein SCO1/2
VTVAASAEPAAPTASASAVPVYQRLADAWIYPNPIPNFDLIDHRARPFELEQLADGYVLVGFIFTTCSVATACPLTTQKMHEVGKLWRSRARGSDVDGRRLRLLTLTIDPDNDTPDVLSKYSELLRKDVPDWVFATGPEPLLQTILPGMFGVSAKPDGRGTIEHTVRVALLGPGLRVRRQWANNDFSAAEVVAEVLR